MAATDLTVTAVGCWWWWVGRCDPMAATDLTVVVGG